MAIGAEVALFIVLMFASTRRYRSGLYLKYLPYCILLFFMAMRYDYGDGRAYRILFDNLHAGNKVDGIEPLYGALNKISPSFGCLIFITSLLYVFAFYVLISRTLSYEQRGLAILVLILHPYILMVDMSTIRQSVAIAIIVLGVYIGNSYKKSYFIPLCIIAALFHKSAIALFPIVFLFKKKPFSFPVKCAIFISTIILLFMPDKLIKLMDWILAGLKLDTKSYLSYLYNGNKNGVPAITLSMMMMAFFMLCGNVVKKENSVYIKLSIIAMALEALQGSVQQFGRMSMYLIPFLIVSLPLILKNDTCTLEVTLLTGQLKFTKTACWIVELCIIAVFAWKFVHFMTPQYAYHSIFFVS